MSADLINALTEVLEAQAEYSREYADFLKGGGVEWGYFGQPHLMKLNEAHDNFMKTLGAYVTETVDQRLKERLS